MKIKTTVLSINELGQRTNQEDSIWPDLNNSSRSEDLFILCDGMGGHECGEVASQTVCETMSAYIRKHVGADDLFTEEDFKEALNAAYDALDAKDNGSVKKMGTTLTFVKFHAGGCFIAHIGDSRVYYFRPSERSFLYVTRDHSLVNDLVALGELTPEEAKVSSQKNVITRAMQPMQESRSRADCYNISDVRPGDYIYMCSDGMLENSEDNEIANILSMDVSDKEKVQIFIGATQENRDNHSAHVIRVLSVEGAAVAEGAGAAAAAAAAAHDVSAAAEEAPMKPALLKSIKRSWIAVSLISLGVLAAVVLAVFLLRKSPKREKPDDPKVHIVNPAHVPEKSEMQMPHSAPIGTPSKPAASSSYGSSSRRRNSPATLTGGGVSATAPAPAPGAAPTGGESPEVTPEHEPANVTISPDADQKEPPVAPPADESTGGEGKVGLTTESK